MNTPRKHWNTTRDPKDAWDYDPPDPTSLEYFDGPFDSIDHKDGRKLSDEESFTRYMAYVARYGCEVVTKNQWNSDDYQASEPNEPSIINMDRDASSSPDEHRS